MNDSRNSGGVGVGFLLFVVFLVLKLTGAISWSWWWVTSPLWLPFCIGVLIVAGTIVRDLASEDARSYRSHERTLRKAREERIRLARSADAARYDEWGKPRD